MDGKPALGLDEFLRERLRSLAKSPRDPASVFCFLEKAVAGVDGPALKDSLLGIRFARSERPAPEKERRWQDFLLHLVLRRPKQATPVEQNPRCEVSVDIEIIGGSKHDQVLAYAAAARDRTAAVDDFSKRLAGLAQNVLDFEEQDEEEVHDSLTSFVRIGSDISFAHKDVAIRFSRRSRPYNTMSHVIGGSPYWFLVQLVLGHNAALLWDLHDDLETQSGQRGMTRMMQLLLRQLPTHFHSIRDAEESLRLTLGRNVRLAHYLPNLFRYTTEQQLYQLFANARGLEAQQAYFRRSEDALEQMVREIAALNKERADARITWMLVAIGAVQFGAGLAAIAATPNRVALLIMAGGLGVILGIAAISLWRLRYRLRPK